MSQRLRKILIKCFHAAQIFLIGIKKRWLQDPTRLAGNLTEVNRKSSHDSLTERLDDLHRQFRRPTDRLELMDGFSFTRIYDIGVESKYSSCYRIGAINNRPCFCFYSQVTKVRHLQTSPCFNTTRSQGLYRFTDRDSSPLLNLRKALGDPISRHGSIRIKRFIAGLIFKDRHNEFVGIHIQPFLAQGYEKNDECGQQEKSRD
ncbi:hypothetical protein ES703_83469 [subsurface metagenome]